MITNNLSCCHPEKYVTEFAEVLYSEVWNTSPPVFATHSHGTL